MSTSPGRSGTTKTPILTTAQLSTTRPGNRSGWQATAPHQQTRTTVPTLLLLIPLVMYTSQGAARDQAFMGTPITRQSSTIRLASNNGLLVTRGSEIQMMKP